MLYLALQFDPSARYLATGDVDGTVRLWEVNSGGEVWSSDMRHAVIALAFGSTGEYVAAIDSAGQARIIEVPTGDLRFELKAV